MTSNRTSAEKCTTFFKIICVHVKTLSPAEVILCKFWINCGFDLKGEVFHTNLDNFQVSSII